MKTATSSTPHTASENEQKKSENRRYWRKRHRIERLKNPIANIIDKLSEELAREIAEVINKAVGAKFVCTGDVPGSIRRSSSTQRRASNEEACKLPFELNCYDFKVDCRHHMPFETASYLEELATRLLKAAVAVRQIKDSRSNRTIKMIRWLVSGRIKAKYDGRKREFVIVTDDSAAVA